MIRLPSKVAALAAGMLMTLACQAQSPTQQPARETPASSINAIGAVATVGAWRKVSDAQFNQQYRFSMLPGVVAAGGKRAVYDYQAGKIVCCLVGRAGDQRGRAGQQLRHSGPVDHRSGQWLEPDAAPYRPRVQLLRAEGAFARLRILGHGRRAGRPAAARPGLAVAPRTLELDGQRYSVTRKDVPLASDDGMVHAYALRPPRAASPWRSRFPTGSIERDRGATRFEKEMAASMSATLQVTEEPLSDEDILLLRRSRSGRLLTAVFAGLMFLLLASSVVLFVVLVIVDRSLLISGDGLVILLCTAAMGPSRCFSGAGC